MNRIFVIIIVVLISLPVFGQISPVRKYSNEFLSIGVGARSLAMGNAQVSSIGDVTAGYWNPAGLLGVKNDFQVGLMHSEWFGNIANYDYGAVAIPLKDQDRVLAVSLIRMGVDNIANTLFLVEPDGTVNYDKITAFSVADYAFLFSYAQPLFNDKLNAGASIKLIHRRAGKFANAWGVGLDVGGQYTLTENIRLGVMARDITTTINAWTFSFTEEEKEVLAQTGNEIPESSTEVTLPRLIVGGSYTYQFENKINLLIELNKDITTDKNRNVLIPGNPFSFDPHVGVEAGYDNFVFLRGGVMNMQRETDRDGDKHLLIQPTFGAGLNISIFAVDYAFTQIGDFSSGLYSHVISLRLDLDKEDNRRRR